jgi:hypothetical protein
LSAPASPPDRDDRADSVFDDVDHMSHGRIVALLLRIVAAG